MKSKFRTLWIVSEWRYDGTIDVRIFANKEEAVEYFSDRFNHCLYSLPTELNVSTKSTKIDDIAIKRIYTDNKLTIVLELTEKEIILN